MNAPSAKNEIAWWMKALNVIIIGILAFKTWACFFEPSLIFGAATSNETAHVKALWELAGRNIAMIAVSLYALLRPSAFGLLPVFLMGLLREGADMVSAVVHATGGPAFNPRAAAFLAFLMLYALAIRHLAGSAGKA